jgi:hypothetical protein
MKKIRILAIAALVAAVLIPAAVLAGGTFYCSTTAATDGDGTLNNPWMCTTEEELNTVIDDRICATYLGGNLYEIFPDSYTLHVITYYSASDCRVTSSTDFAGFPPDTGVNIPTPVIVAGAALAGAGLVAAGIFLKNKQEEVTV